MQASTVLTEVRLRAGSVHHGRPAVFKGPPGPSPGRDGARTLVIFGPFGEFPGNVKKASNPRLGKNRKTRKTHLLFRFFVPGKSYGKSIGNFLGNGRISLNTKFRGKIPRQRRRRRTREDGEGAALPAAPPPVLRAAPPLTWKSMEVRTRLIPEDRENS